MQYITSGNSSDCHLYIYNHDRTFSVILVLKTVFSILFSSHKLVKFMVSSEASLRFDLDRKPSQTPPIDVTAAWWLLLHWCSWQHCQSPGLPRHAGDWLMVLSDCCHWSGVLACENMTNMGIKCQASDLPCANESAMSPSRHPKMWSLMLKAQRQLNKFSKIWFCQSKHMLAGKKSTVSGTKRCKASGNHCFRLFQTHARSVRDNCCHNVRMLKLVTGMLIKRKEGTERANSSLQTNWWYWSTRYSRLMLLHQLCHTCMYKSIYQYYGQPKWQEQW